MKLYFLGFLIIMGTHLVFPSEKKEIDVIRVNTSLNDLLQNHITLKQIKTDVDRRLYAWKATQYVASSLLGWFAYTMVYDIKNIDVNFTNISPSVTIEFYSKCMYFPQLKDIIQKDFVKNIEKLQVESTQINFIQIVATTLGSVIPALIIDGIIPHYRSDYPEYARQIAIVETSYQNTIKSLTTIAHSNTSNYTLMIKEYKKKCPSRACHEHFQALCDHMNNNNKFE